MCKCASAAGGVREVKMDILINLTIPALVKKYDVLIPSFLTVGELTPLIVKAVEDLSEQRYHASGGELLCNECGYLDSQLTLYQHNIKNGEQLWLF